MSNVQEKRKDYTNYIIGEDEAAEFLNMPVLRLRILRNAGCGPKCEAYNLKYAEYKCSDLASWQAKRMFHSASYIKELENALVIKSLKLRFVSAQGRRQTPA